MIKYFLFILLWSTLATAQPLALIDISGTINPGSASFIEQSIHRAEEQKLQGLIVRLNTPGGLLSSTRSIISAFSTSTIPVIIFVAPGGASATSAGAILSLAAHFIVMAPGTNFGAAHPVQNTGEDIKGTMGEKVTNDTAALVRAQSLLHHRNGDLAEDLVRKSVSYSSQEAIDKKFADFGANDLDDLLQKLDGQEIKIAPQSAPTRFFTKDLKQKDLVVFNMSAGQHFLHFLSDPNVSAMLLAAGGVTLYAEMSSGFTVLAPGIIGVIALILAFMSLQTLPISAGGLLLFVAGLGLLFTEAFIVSHGILAVSGIFCIGTGALFLIDPMSGGTAIRVSWFILGPIISALALVVFFIASQLAQTRGLKKHGYDPIVGQDGRVDSVGADGRSGKVFVQGELWNFTSEHPVFVGDKAKITSKHNLQVKISKVP